MPLDPNIALQVGQPVQPLDPMKAYGQVLTLKNLMDQQRMQGLQLEKAQRDEADARGLRSAYAVTPEGEIDEQTTIKNLVGGGYGPQAVDFRHKMMTDKSAAAKAEREAKKAEYEMLLKQNEIVGQELGALPEVPTYEQALTVSRRLNARGVQHDEREIPQDPAEIAEYIRQRRAANLSSQQQLAELAPKSPLGKLLEDQRREQARTAAISQSAVTGEASVDANGNLVAPTVNISAPPDPYAAAVARETYGPADSPFQYGPDGKVRPNLPVQEYGLKKARAGASNVNVGVQAYDKELNKQDAQAVSDARKGAEQAASAASDARAIAQILKGQNSGKWTEMQAALGGWLPNTPYANVTSIVSLAEGIRARAAPALRVPGSGAMSDFETKQLLGIFPQLLQSDDGRELAARVLERVADRQAIAADIKDEMVRAGKYSVKRFNDEVRARFGDGLLDPEEKKLVARMQGGKQKPAAGGAQAPSFNINGLPNPAENTGRVIESEKGVRLRSDGKKWVPVQ